MKKIYLLLLVFVLVCSTVYAADVNVQINGDIIDFTDSQGNKVNAQIINDRTMVPFRKIFNVLGVSDDNIQWFDSTKTIVAIENNLKLTLQIGNNVAVKSISGETEEIKLDSAPVIVEGRTLVPLRFIAESMGKTVGWDNTNRTAIIIDYNYFLNEIKKKDLSFYNYLMNDNSKINFKVTKNYYDLENSQNNNTFIVSGLIDEMKYSDRIYQNGVVNFGGTNELAQEIMNEGWAEIRYENNYYKDFFTTKALNDGLKKIYVRDVVELKYDDFNCAGNVNDSLYDLFKYFCGIDEKTLNTSTFKGRRTEFSNLLNTLKKSKGIWTTGNVNAQGVNIEYFDFTELENLFYDSTFNRAYTFLNNQFFKSDADLETLFYDYPNQQVNIRCSDVSLIVDLIMSNEYNEKVEYKFEINKI